MVRTDFCSGVQATPWSSDKKVNREEKRAMKEITRRLYTKPVMLGIAFLAGAVLLAGLFVTANSRAAAPTSISEGDDKFETTGNGETYHNFGASPIPRDFFGQGSEEFRGVVPLVGVPIPGQGEIDTIVHRAGCASVPCNAAIEMTHLSLKGIGPITVTFPNHTESWEVFVGLSTFKDSTGTMAIGPNTFDSSLKVWPKFTFVRGATILELDTGDPNGPGLTAAPDTAVGEAVEFEPAPAPAPCPVVVSEFEPHANASVSAAAAASCAPVTLTSSNSPWVPCGNGGFCIPQPITEAELLASHNASPPGTKKKKAIAVKGGVAQ
jgi:hypothetical protein